MDPESGKGVSHEHQPFPANPKPSRTGGVTMETLETATDEAGLAAQVSQAFSSRTPLEIVGGGTKLAFGGPVEADRRLSIAGLTGISLYEPAALTIIARAGTPLREIEEALAAEDQRLPFEPADYTALLGSQGEPTIGGTIACGISGPGRIQAGAARDSLIGVRFITGEGEIVKNGGRVMKNVTGYDLVKLMCGSHGTLGVLTELAFKVLPKPETTSVVHLKGLSDETAIAALSAALVSPFDVTGAAHAPQGPDGGPVTMIRAQGFAASVRYRSEKLRDLLAPFAAADIDTSNRAQEDWQWVRDVEAFAGRQGAVWRISCKPSDGPVIVATIKASIAIETLYDWGGGLVWLLVPESGDCGAGVIRASVDIYGGHATLVRAPHKVRAVIPVFHPQPPPLEAISQGFRRRFDPAGILNPGRMNISTQAA
jgi:glycolate dehydrogenase FAD-binding subunit